MVSVLLRFDRGTLCIEGYPDAATLPGVLWDPRACAFRAPAHAAPSIVAELRDRGLEVDRLPWPASRLDEPDEPGEPGEPGERVWLPPTLRPYQQSALDAWLAFDRRGVVVVPTGGGKTRIALAAMALTRAPTAVLCPTRALLEQWRGEIAKVYRAPVGVVGDGERRVEALTVMTFESAYRQMDALGDRFALLVVDEAHHFASGARSEALETTTAPFRLGLTATAPAPPRRDGERGHLDALVGRVVSEVSLESLLGTHLADLDMVRVSVALTRREREEYLRLSEPLLALARVFRRTNPHGDWAALVAALSESDAGRAALRAFRRATDLCSLPEAKLTTTLRLIERHAHQGDKVLIFTQSVDDAYRIGHEALAPVLSAETSREERDHLLAGFRAGALRVLVSARVLNEGLDVPDARVAILAGGSLGTRELVQRVGRVLRAAPGKRALVYELTTADTIEERRAARRRAHLVAAFPALG